MVGAVQGEGYACVNHVFTVAYGTANTEHYFFVRTIVSADCSSIFTAVVAVACGEGQFVVRIEVHRMQGCQSSCACANLVYTAAQLVNAVSVVGNFLIGFVQLAAIYSVLRCCADFTCSYVGNLLVISIQAFIADIGLVANFDAVNSDILIKRYSVILATFIIGTFGYSNVIACCNSGVLFSNICNIIYTSIQSRDSISVILDSFSIILDSSFICIYAAIKLRDSFSVILDSSFICSYAVIGFFQLAAVDSVSRGAADFACSYAADLTVLINSNLIVNLNIAAIQNDGRSTVGDLVAGYIDICQFCTLISIYTIFGCNIAGGFNSTVSTADAYIFAGQVAKHDILVQVNLVNLLTIVIKFFNIDVGAIYNLAVFACFGCYCMQLAAVYCVSRISGYCACCYTGNLAVCSNSYFAQFSTFSGDLAVIAICIAYKQLTVTQCGMFIEYTVFQNYVADYAFVSSYFAKFSLRSN